MRRSRWALHTSVLALLAALVSPACSGVQTLDTTTVKTTSLSDLAESAVDEGELLAPDMEPMIIEIPAGQVVPLAIDVQLPFLTVEAGDNSVRFQRDVKIYLAPNEALISFDGERWARIGDWDALKDIAGAEQGSTQHLGDVSP